MGSVLAGTIAPTSKSASAICQVHIQHRPIPETVLAGSCYPFGFWPTPYNICCDQGNLGLECRSKLESAGQPGTAPAIKYYTEYDTKHGAPKLISHCFIPPEERKCHWNVKDKTGGWHSIDVSVGKCDPGLGNDGFNFLCCSEQAAGNDPKVLSLYCWPQEKLIHGTAIASIEPSKRTWDVVPTDPFAFGGNDPASAYTDGIFCYQRENLL